jgi:NAD(P)-dependent dehydrogenase (short-subunit alcohol dehydrogenase family)
VALRLAEAGAAVAVAARTRAEVEAVAELVRGKGGKAAAVAADVSRSEDVGRMFGEARGAFGAVDILVNGAGVAPSALLAKTSDELWRSAIETNLSGVFYCIREAIGPMAEGGWGRIVSIASIAGKTGYPYIAAYAASKHGVLGLTKCAALEVGAKGVTVNAVCPGYVDTPMTDRTMATIQQRTGMDRDAALRAVLEQSHQARLITPDEVARAVMTLSGEDAGDRNGEAVLVEADA